MPTTTTQIEIAASPAEVRAQFLDFDSYSGWSTSFIKSISVTAGDKTNPKEGDKLEVVLPGMTINPVLLTNTPELFKWRGTLPISGIFDGDHAFHFTPSTTSPGHTLLVHEEVFSGILTFLVGPTWSFGKKTKANFEGFNHDLKAKVEGNGKK